MIAVGLVASGSGQVCALCEYVSKKVTKEVIKNTKFNPKKLKSQ